MNMYSIFTEPTESGSFRDCPPGNHLHWYRQPKWTAKSIKPTQKTQNTI